MQATPEGTLTLRKASQGGGSSQEIRADLVVGADGVSSGIRRSLGLGVLVKTLPEGATRLLVARRPGERGNRSAEYWGGRHRLLITPCSPDDLYVALMGPEDDRRARAVPVDTARWAELFPRHQDLLHPHRPGPGHAPYQRARQGPGLVIWASVHPGRCGAWPAAEPGPGCRPRPFQRRRAGSLPRLSRHGRGRAGPLGGPLDASRQDGPAVVLLVRGPGLPVACAAARGPAERAACPYDLWPDAPPVHVAVARRPRRQPPGANPDPAPQERLARGHCCSPSALPEQRIPAASRQRYTGAELRFKAAESGTVISREIRMTPNLRAAGLVRMAAEIPAKVIARVRATNLAVLTRPRRLLKRGRRDVFRQARCAAMASPVSGPADERRPNSWPCMSRRTA